MPPSAPSTPSPEFCNCCPEPPGRGTQAGGAPHVPLSRRIVWCVRTDGSAKGAPVCLWRPGPQPVVRQLPRQRVSRGGLSGWQRKAVTDFIEANLGEALRLTDIAQLARLSPYHFSRAFKQSFGVPPHRYHVGRRIARAKELLADPGKSVTGIARELGFAETSSFSATFRRVTGASPSDFRRRLA